MDMAGRNEDPTASISHPTFDPQIPGGDGGLSDSLPFPSQPPDIRNWFPSYEYETPDISDDLRFLLESYESKSDDPLAQSGYRSIESPDTTEDHNPISRNYDADCNGDAGSLSSLPSGVKDRDVCLVWKDPKLVDYVASGRSSDLREANRVTCEEEALLNCNVGEDGFVSTRKNEDTIGIVGNLPSELNSNAVVESLRNELAVMKDVQNCNVVDEGFASTSKNDDTRGSAVNLPSELNSKAEVEGSLGNEFAVVKDAKNYIRNTQPKLNSFPQTGILQRKKKQNLRWILGEEFRNKCYEGKKQEIRENASKNSFIITTNRGNLKNNSIFQLTSIRPDRNDLGGVDHGVHDYNNASSFEECKQSPEKFPGNNVSREGILCWNHPERSDLVSARANLDLKAKHDLPGEKELSENFTNGNCSFISKNDNIMRCNYENFPTNLSPRLNCEVFTKNEDCLKDTLEVSHKGTECISSKAVLSKSSLFNPISHEGDGMLIKRKQSLRQMLGEEFLLKRGEDDDSNVNSRKTNDNLFKGKTPIVNVIPDKSEDKSHGEVWRSVGNLMEKLEDGTFSANQSILTCNNRTGEDAAASCISLNSRGNPKGNIAILQTKSNATRRCSEAASLDGIDGHLITEELTLQDQKRNIVFREQLQAAKRIALADKTNLQSGVEASAPEILGKWKCPRKSKAYLGPQLKQLRLENWVRRLN